MGKGRIVPSNSRKKVLWVGDAVAHTGFSVVTDNIVSRLEKWFDIFVLGINYYGDPHDKKYPVFPASLGGDVFGVNRLHGVIQHVQPDVVCVLNDPWIIDEYTSTLRSFPNIKKIAYVPIDSPNVPGKFFRNFDVFDIIVAYTQFGKEEILKHVNNRVEVVYHGVEKDLFYPEDKKKSREFLGLPNDWFIVGSVNRNQPRKRLDLLFQAFHLFVNDKPDNVKLFYHGALKDVGWDLEQLAHYFGIDDRFVITSRDITPFAGVKRNIMRHIYNSFDVFVSTTLGEGFGLTNLEASACGVPQIVPHWSALACWLEKGAIHVPCSSIYVNTGGINTIGGVVDIPKLVEAMENVYYDANLREQLRKDSLDLMQDKRFGWDFAANEFYRFIKELINLSSDK